MKDIPAERPQWVPKRIEWYPGESPRGNRLTIREATSSDYSMIARFTHTALGRVVRWANQHGYSAYIASRNTRNALAVIAARHGPDETTVLRFYCSPVLPLRATLITFITLLACEVPEYSMRWRIKLADAALTGCLRGLGWQVDSSDDEAGTTVLTRPALIGRPAGLGQSGDSEQ